MSDYYQDKQEFLDQIRIAKYALEELEKYSVHNGDIFLDEIISMLKQLDDMDTQISRKHALKSNSREERANWKQELVGKLDTIVEAIERLEVKP